MGTNTKMYKTISETTDYLRQLCKLTETMDRERLTLFVIPSYTALQAAHSVAGREKILLGAQNMCWAEQGQFTGEISPRMLAEVGVGLVEIGHSERRHIFGETDEQERMKVTSAVEQGFIALLCVGETEEEKTGNRTAEVLRRQLEIGLGGVARERADRIWVAYEPVWAIGVEGKPVTPDYVEERHAFIRGMLKGIFGPAAGGRIPVLYGGGVNEDNAESLIEVNGVDGLFIGRAAWQADRFAQIIDRVMKRATGERG